MLQQTRVETVVPYYERWVARFPNVAALADASEDDVLGMWEGLGYYHRVRNLRNAALLVRERHGGCVPSDPAALRALPGIGDYTAAAIASIAFDAPAPAIDGNARRVLCRVFDIARPAPARLRAAAASWFPARAAGDFNQAVMELGARICTPTPRCEACPLHDQCRARARGTVHRRPPPARRRATPHFDVACAILLDPDGRILLTRRPGTGLLAGMWELPGLETTPAGAAAAARRLAAMFAGMPLPRSRRLEPVPHVFSHKRITYHPFLFRLDRPRRGRSDTMEWAGPARRARLALPAAQRRILHNLDTNGASGI